MPEEKTSPLASTVPLTQAPVEVQLAVELIMLLEQQQLPTATVLAALKLVMADFRRNATPVSP